MPVGLTEEHRALASAMGGLAQRHAPRELTRQGLEGLIAGKLPGYWKPLLDAGLLTLHLPEEHGGDDADAVAVAVVLEEAGRALLPGPFLPTVLAGAVLAQDPQAASAVLGRLADGATGACAVEAGGLVASLPLTAQCG